jgi:hypothetical protein
MEGKGRKLTRQNATDEDDGNSDIKNKDQIITIKRQYHSEECGKENGKNKFFSQSLPEDQLHSKTVLLVREKSCSLISVDTYLSGAGAGGMSPRPRLQIQLTKHKDSQDDHDTVILLYIRVFVVLTWHYSRKESHKLDITLDSTVVLTRV